MRPRRYGDAGQAFPIYITVVGGLLFLAFAYFAVGQAAVNRNGAQTAADAAALAAAQKTRDQLAGLWVGDVLDPTKWQDVFDGEGAVGYCWRADQLAAHNHAHTTGCDAGLLDYRVEVQTDKPVGESIVPGTERHYAHASARAVIEPLCTFKLPAEGAGDDVLPRLTCRGGRFWDLNPDDLTDLPGPEDLFDVHLAD
ncbi:MULTISPECIES: pilus assembly protein TadG-related protein [unclassified Streptomyces]|uniref:pilus assembly protein TadG-related protein n=1 Tax=unclassified Streptomyces TaxID=2593676 RepID=UPI0022528DA1|nr:MULTISPECIES: pilus assembly protein TadG-related protein [unclassified Streptomyces]MCX5248648.1 pilus assembly protein TadG-related protein [Streptomyces sp. NBC_00201]MCX5293258.1 pilus assembly protein TadG-related protein [Streptomyces sp. NBC_00183]